MRPDEIYFHANALQQWANDGGFCPPDEGAAERHCWNLPLQESAMPVACHLQESHGNLRGSAKGADALAPGQQRHIQNRNGESKEVFPETGMQPDGKLDGHRQRAPRWRRLSNPWVIDKHVHSTVDGKRRHQADGWSTVDYDEVLEQKCRRFRTVLRKCFDNDEDFYLVLLVKGEVVKGSDLAAERKVGRWKITREVDRILRELNERLAHNPDLRTAVLSAWRELRVIE